MAEKPLSYEYNNVKISFMVSQLIKNIEKKIFILQFFWKKTQNSFITD